MKSIRLLAIVLCASLALLLILQPIQPVQAEATVATTCDLAAVHGSYEFVAPATIQLAPGTVIAIPDELIAASPAAFASKGTLIFTGNGHIILSAYEDANGPLATPVEYEGNYTANTNSARVVTRSVLQCCVQYEGDYALNANCTAMMTLGNGAQFGVKLVNSGGVQVLVSTTPGFVIVRPAPVPGR